MQNISTHGYALHRAASYPSLSEKQRSQRDSLFVNFNLSCGKISTMNFVFNMASATFISAFYISAFIRVLYRDLVFVISYTVIMEKIAWPRVPILMNVMYF